MKLMTVVGARPQFIKAAVVSRALRAQPGICEVLVHTGQHYDPNMSAVFFEELHIPQPDYHLGIGGGGHGEQTGRMLTALEQAMTAERPAWVLVYGDTNSTLAGALAAAKLHIPIAHVEAGLRSFNRRMPEEINRVLTDHVSSLLFTPTDSAVANLRCEGISEERIRPVGDVMYDAALFYREIASRSAILDQQCLAPRTYVLATIHRAENTDDSLRLRAIIEGLIEISGTLPVLLPLHPRTRGSLLAAGFMARAEDHLRIIEPLGYLEMVHAVSSAALIVTDSGGVQKEAFFHHVPCVTVREETEWGELISLGWNRLAPPVSAAVVSNTALAALREPHPPGAEGVYGYGDSGMRVARALVSAGDLQGSNIERWRSNP